MARIENTTTHAKHLTLLTGQTNPISGVKEFKTFIIPPGQQGDSKRENGVCDQDVPDDLLDRNRKDPIIASWFESEDLIVKQTSKAPDKVDKDKGDKR